MTKEEIVRMAFDLGTAISQSDEMGKILEMQTKIQDDPDAYALLMRFQEARIQAENKMKEGMELTDSEKNHLTILDQQLNNNPIISQMMGVQEQFDNLMQGVYTAMNQAISGAASCSSGGCEGCSGCQS